MRYELRRGAQGTAQKLGALGEEFTIRQSGRGGGVGAAGGLATQSGGGGAGTGGGNIVSAVQPEAAPRIPFSPQVTAEKNAPVIKIPNRKTARQERPPHTDRPEHRGHVGVPTPKRLLQSRSKGPLDGVIGVGFEQQMHHGREALSAGTEKGQTPRREKPGH